MHDIIELPAWERLFKKIIWEQIGDLEGKKILDFGSGEGITANHFAKNNDVTAIEPSEEMLSNAWKDYEYTQIVGDEDWQRKMLQLEMRVAQIPEYIDIAFFHHLKLKKD